MKKFNKTIGIILSSTLFLTATANSQNTKDMTFSRSRAVTDSLPDQPVTPKYEFGIGAGIVAYQGDLAPTVWGQYKSLSPAVQAHITRLFSPAFALRLGVTVGQFKADDVKSAFKESYRDYRRYNFTTSFAEISALAQWTPFAKSNWRLNPYVMGGAGVSFVKVKNDWSKIGYDNFPGENLQQRLQDDSAHSHNFPTFVLPLGVGLKYDVSQKVALRLEWINRITFTDYLDGFSKAANPDKNDRYSSVMLTLNFAFGKNKKSETSKNYNVINNYYYNNSSKNSKDENSMASNDNGSKPNAASTATSNDVAENATIKNLQAKLDAITQKLDEAQQKNDANNSAAQRKSNGNSQDAVDNENDKVNISKFDKYIIYFSFDHSYLEGESYGKLDQIAKTMKADPKLNVTLNGYTDLKGSSEYNMKLSSARAVACKDYLISRGVEAGRIKDGAFGKSKYIVGHGDAVQQWRNRRVEVYIN
jgi:OOP family OmpA-OmpF porin